MNTLHNKIIAKDLENAPFLHESECELKSVPKGMDLSYFLPKTERIMIKNFDIEVLDKTMQKIIVEAVNNKIEVLEFAKGSHTVYRCLSINKHKKENKYNFSYCGSGEVLYTLTMLESLIEIEKLKKKNYYYEVTERVFLPR